MCRVQTVFCCKILRWVEQPKYIGAKILLADVELTEALAIVMLLFIFIGLLVKTEFVLCLN